MKLLAKINGLIHRSSNYIYTDLGNIEELKRNYIFVYNSLDGWT